MQMCHVRGTFLFWSMSQSCRRSEFFILVNPSIRTRTALGDERQKHTGAGIDSEESQSLQCTETSWEDTAKEAARVGRCVQICATCLCTCHIGIRIWLHFWMFACWQLLSLSPLPPRSHMWANWEESLAPQLLAPAGSSHTGILMAAPPH